MRGLHASWGLTAVCSWALCAPALAGDSSAELVAALKGERTDAGRTALVAKLRAKGEAAKAALIGSWVGAPEENAAAILYLLGDLRGEDVRVDLMQASRARTLRLREVGALCLSGFPHKETYKRLLSLADDREGQVGISSLESLQILAAPETFEPLLRLAKRLVNENPTDPRLVKLKKALSGILAKNKQKQSLVIDLCRAAGEFEGPGQALVYGVLAAGEGPKLPPVLRALVGEYMDPDGADYNALGRAVGDRSVADRLRPISPALAAAAVTGLGHARDKEGAALLIKALEAKSADVRLATLRVCQWVLPKGPRDLGEEAPSDFPALRRDAIKVVILRLSDRDGRVRDAAHAWLKRETKQPLARSYPAWKSWFDAYFGPSEEVQ